MNLLLHLDKASTRFESEYRPWDAGKMKEKTTPTVNFKALLWLTTDMAETSKSIS